MSGTPDDANHHYHAVEANNRAWDLAFTHLIHAHAAATAGKSEVHRDSHQLAEQAMAAITADEDRAIVEATFRQVPVPEK